MLFASVGGNGGSSGKGRLVAYDLRRNRGDYVSVLANSRYLFELDRRGRVPVRTGTRSGIAYR
jgi:hypothetical protein